MFQRPILMNEEDASPGGGAPTPVETTAPQAQGAAQPTYVTMDALKSVLTEAMTGMRNGFHADLRKAGVYDTKPTKAAAPADVPSATAAPMASGQTVDVQQMLARESAFVRAVAPAGLSDEQYAFVDETYRAVNPPDPRAWAAGFLKAMGIGKTNASPPPTNDTKQAPVPGVVVPAAVQRVAPDLGSPAPGNQRDEEAVLLNRPLDANNHDFERLVSKHGKEKALQMWRDGVNSHLRGIRLVPDNRRQR